MKLFLGEINMSFLEKFKKIFGKEEGPVMEHTLIEETPIMETVPEVKLPHSEPKIKKESFVCDCGYEFSLNLDKTSKVICPWCGRKQ